MWWWQFECIEESITELVTKLSSEVKIWSIQEDKQSSEQVRELFDCDHTGWSGH